MANNKEEIIETRTGGLGSSDANMVVRIAESGIIGESAKQRLAVMLGLEKQNIFSTAATNLGNNVEDILFEALQKKFPTAISNPKVSKDKSTCKFGFSIFNHIDFEVENEDTIFWYECKATIDEDIDDVIKKYYNQLQWHWMLLEEKAKLLNKKPTLFIVHYNTTDILETGLIEFTENNPKFKEIEKHLGTQRLFKKGLEIIAKEIQNFEYTPDETLSAYNLPVEQQEYIEKIAVMLNEVAEREATIDAFKANMLALMVKNNVKSIKNDYFNITVVPESFSTRIDSKKLKEEHPVIYSKFTKSVQTKSYIKITIKK